VTVQEETTGLERELEFFNKHRGEYLERFPGLFVLIRGDEMRGPFPSAEAAYEDGLRAFGLEPFLVKQVLAEEPVEYMPVFFSAPVGRARL
jgi:hypothetical protein